MENSPAPITRAPLFLFFLNVLVIATCGLIYELLAGTLASYVLGDSVTQFSFVIGTYLFALGVGAWLSRFVEKGLARTFIEVELGVALLGGASAAILFVSSTFLSWFHILLYSIVLAIGILVGLELPLLMRILKNHLDFGDLVSRVFAFDYIGSLVAAILFPILFVPYLGLVRTSMVFGLVNALVGLWGTWLLRPLLPANVFGLRVRALLVIALLATGIGYADRLTDLAEENLYSGTIVHARRTPYQRIVVTRGAGGFQLHLNGNLQFNSVDEYRYHEALVHPAMRMAVAPEHVLVLGGGDGLAVREVLRWDDVRKVTLVDIDPGMTALSSEFAPLAKLNEFAFEDPRVEVINQDALIWLESAGGRYDVAIVDFPDPSTYSLGKLYTRRFYRLLKARLQPQASVAVQCTSPLLARRSFWCIIRTMEAAGFDVRPYHASLPSFGIWGFALGSVGEADPIPKALPEGKFLDESVFASLFVLPPDLGPQPVEINRLDNQVLVRYYETDWSRWQ
jgi:spermidine synthase